MARWDWYQGTVHGVDVRDIASDALKAFDLVDLVPCRPKNGYEQGAQVRRGLRTLCEIWWGGNPGVHVKGTSEDAPAVAELLRKWPHRVSRADACEDWVEEGLFDRLSSVLIAFAVAARIRLHQVGDWVQGKGRTLYLGGDTSSVQLMLYEKGAERGVALPWVRLEVMVRPKGQAGYQVASWAPGQAFGAAPWLVEALRHIGWDHLTTQSVGTVWRPSDSERAKRQLVRQYRATIRAWKAECGESWEQLGHSFEKLEQELESGSLLH